MLGAILELNSEVYLLLCDSAEGNSVMVRTGLEQRHYNSLPCETVLIVTRYVGTAGDSLERSAELLTR